MDTWRKILEEQRAEQGNDSTPIVAVSPDESVLDVEFDAGYGSSQGPEVLIWTESRVYFPVVYDGAEWLGSAPRNPIVGGQAHVGGE